MHPILPPYALPPVAFPFRHLAGLAGRAPIGGAREVALACFLSARLAADRLAAPLPEGTRTLRGTGARGWLSTLALPAPTRVPVQRCLEAATAGSLAELAAAMRELSTAVAEYLEPAARAELDQLAALLAS